MSTQQPTNPNRVPAGVRTGGQFATGAKSEANVSLPTPTPDVESVAQQVVTARGIERFYDGEPATDTLFAAMGDDITYEAGIRDIVQTANPEADPVEVAARVLQDAKVDYEGDPVTALGWELGASVPASDAFPALVRHARAEQPRTVVPGTTSFEQHLNILEQQSGNRGVANFLRAKVEHGEMSMRHVLLLTPEQASARLDRDRAVQQGLGPVMNALHNDAYMVEDTGGNTMALVVHDKLHPGHVHAVTSDGATCVGRYTTQGWEQGHDPVERHEFAAPGEAIAHLHQEAAPDARKDDSSYIARMTARRRELVEGSSQIVERSLKEDLDAESRSRIADQIHERHGELVKLDERIAHERATQVVDGRSAAEQEALWGEWRNAKRDVDEFLEQHKERTGR